MPKSILIIGAGIAGLSAGCYAQMNGFHSQISGTALDPRRAVHLVEAAGIRL